MADAYWEESKGPVAAADPSQADPGPGRNSRSRGFAALPAAFAPRPNELSNDLGRVRR